MNRPALILLALAAALPACTSVRQSDPPRTATEQFLLSTAANAAVDQLSADPLRGRSVYVDTTYFDLKGNEYVVGALRARLLEAGAQMKDKRDDAEAVVEVRSNGIGIDRYEFMLGVPALPIGVAVNAAGGPSIPITTPEVAVVKNTRQWGTAAIGIVAYWRDTGSIITSSGPFVGRSSREDWWYFGSGPQSIGDIPPIEPVRQE